MTVWNTELRQHNHELHAFIAVLRPSVEEFAPACDGWMASHTSTALPIRVQVTTIGERIEYAVEDHTGNIGTIEEYETLEAADAEVAKRLGALRCLHCGTYEAYL